MEGFANLVTAVLCAVLMAICLEQADFRGSAARLLLTLLLAFAAGMVTYLTMRRFVSLFTRAELYGHRSTCPGCQCYARFEVIAAQGSSLQVRCRSCQNEWRVP